MGCQGFELRSLGFKDAKQVFLIPVIFSVFVFFFFFSEGAGVSPWHCLAVQAP